MTDRTVGIGEAAKALGLSVSRVRQLTTAGVFTASTTSGGHRRYDLGVVMREWQAHRMGMDELWSRAYPLIGLDESKVWNDLKQILPEGLTGSGQRILGYAVTEMVNNAIDHSEGTTVAVTIRSNNDTIIVEVRDDGIGVFFRMAQTFGLPDPAAAVVEITKGKRTTSPDRHSGEGLFFTSKVVDVFELSANGYRVVFDNTVGDVALGQATGSGTLVVLKLSLASARELAAVFSQYTDAQGEFNRTIPLIKLVQYGGDFLSRSEARRFAEGLEQFERVVLDFTGVEMIGQGFADELFRVWNHAHPEVQLLVHGANPAVELMINRV